MKLKFCGGVGTVTGACFLLENNTKILVDCGLQQGYFPKDKDPNYDPFLFNPKEIDYLIITHAHIDHIGKIGKLVKEGFEGVIISTEPTKEIAGLMMDDAIKVMGYKNKEPLYSSDDVGKALNLWETLNYNSKRDIEDFSLNLKDAGHVLGSVIAEITEKESGKKIIFSGDLGNSPSPLLKDKEKIEGADYVVMESVYGDRVHAKKSERKERIKQVINRVAKRGGTLMVPVFSLEKTQIFLKELNDLIEDGEVASVPVFFDSPLGIKITNVYQRYTDYFNDSVQKEIQEGDDIFDFPKLEITMRQRDSKEISNNLGPKIIVSSSGLSEGGRITSHEKRFLPDKKNALLLIGYQISGSVGRKIQDGNKKVKIGKDWIKIRAEIAKVSGYSSHADSEGLLEFLEGTAESVKKVFVVMGEPKSSLHFVQRSREYLEVDASVPDLGEEFEL